MADQAVAVESQPTPMDVSSGPLVNITPEQRQEFRKTGELPGTTKETPKKPEESAPSDPPKEAEADAGDPPPPKTEQERSERDKAKSAKRFNDLLEENKRLKADLETRKPSEPKPEPKAEVAPPPTRPKPTVDEKNPDGTPKYKEYEDYIEELADWKAEQREVKAKREAEQSDQAKKTLAKVDEAKSRYENFTEVVKPFVDALADPKIPGVVRAMVDDSEVFADLAFVLAGDDKFLDMAKTQPGKAIRFIALTESLIAEELAGKPKPADEEAPVKPKTQAPRPPSEAGGRAAAPPDPEAAAIAASGGKLTASVKAEFTRRALAKLKG